MHAAGACVFSINLLNHYYSFHSVKDDWNNVATACISLAVKWKQLCTSLGLSFDTIRTIKDENANDSEDSLSEGLMQWILQKFNIEKYGLPSWRSLLKTIGRVDQPLFEKLAKEHQVKCMYCVSYNSTVLLSTWHNKLCVS